MTTFALIIALARMLRVLLAAAGIIISGYQWWVQKGDVAWAIRDGVNGAFMRLLRSGVAEERKLVAIHVLFLLAAVASIGTATPKDVVQALVANATMILVQGLLVWSAIDTTRARGGVLAAGREARREHAAESRDVV